MELRTRYAKTRDGVRIAYGTIGSGEPLLVAGNIWGDVHTYLHTGIRVLWDALAAMGVSVTLYDCRGMGSSDRGVQADLASRMLDLEAVVEAVGLEKFGLCGLASAGPAAVEYAAAHAENVSRLILANGYVRGRDWYDLVPAMKVSASLVDMMQDDWETYCLTMANAVLDFTDAEAAANLAGAFRASAGPADFLAYMEGTLDIDVFERLSQISVPTLVMHIKGWLRGSMPLMREAAAQIPDAQFIEVEAGRKAAAAMAGFLLESGGPAGAAPGKSAFRTVLFTDLVGHTEMMSRLGDERGRAVLREHERITREVLKANGGTEVKTMGDGFMASFGSVTRAVECAVALQKAMDAWNRDPRPLTPDPLLVRVGLNAGEPIEEDGDLFGATVILASRIAAKADGGEILVSDNVRSLCSGKGFLFADRGEFVAKGFEEPVRVYEVRWRG